MNLSKSATARLRIKHELEAWKAVIRLWRLNGSFHECVTTPRGSFKQLVSEKSVPSQARIPDRCLTHTNLKLKLEGLVEGVMPSV